MTKAERAEAARITEAARIIRRHYRLNRPVTPDEVAETITSLRRQGRLHLDCSQHRLASALDLDLTMDGEPDA